MTDERRHIGHPDGRCKQDGELHERIPSIKHAFAHLRLIRSAHQIDDGEGVDQLHP